ncbi:MAG: C40 family peptidase [Muribaculaceae bacterium]|nr:C40 family peptidase [Muribaculaceae bacterium]
MKRKAIVFLSFITAISSFALEPLDKTKNIINNIKAQYAPDKRQSVYELDAVYIPSKDVLVTGKISDKTAYNALIDEFKKEGLDVLDYIVLLPDTVWAQTRIPVASIRVSPSHAAEMATQSILGQPLRVLEETDSWYRVQTPDGYIGWVTSSSIFPKTDEDMAQWRNGERLIVVSPYQTHVWEDEKTTSVRQVVTGLVNGSIVTGKYNKKKKRLLVTLPDGRQGWIPTADVLPIEDWAAQNFDADVILDTAYSMEGTPYLWGGTSTKTLDCSGLVKVSYLANGIILMRDASQQALTGTRIAAEDWRDCEAGDLLFFGNADTGKVTHVAIYDENGNYIHSSGRVKRNSVDPQSDLYLTTPFLHAVRIKGNEGTPGITYARNHPWYFDK